MPARWIVFLLCFLPAIVYTAQESDMDLFEFLATYEEKDNDLIDDEMDNSKPVKVTDKQDITRQKETKSEANEE